MITITDLKMQRRWTLWRLESGPDGKPTKPPYSPGGFKHDITNPDNLKTYADLEPLAGNGFTGLGFALGTFDGVSVWGVDIDKCCDAVTGKFSPESRQAVIDLDTYGEFSPSGTGCHVVGLGKLPIEPGHKREVLVRPFPGAKQIEIKGLGFYFTYTDRHLSKTPAVLILPESCLRQRCGRYCSFRRFHTGHRLPEKWRKFSGVFLALSSSGR